MVEMVKGLVARGHSVDEYCPATADLTFMPLDNYVGRKVVLPFEIRGAAQKRVPYIMGNIRNTLAVVRVARGTDAMRDMAYDIKGRIDGVVESLNGGGG